MDQSCRVCLAYGEIPIFGEDEDSSISDDITIFGDIQISKDDDFPKHICDSCFQLLMGAIVFRNIAKYSDEVLKNTFEGETQGSYLSRDTQSAMDTNIDMESVTSDMESDVVSIKEGNGNETMIVIVEGQKKTHDIEVSVEETTHSCNLCNMEFESLEDHHKHLDSIDHIIMVKRSSKISCQICNLLVSENKYEKHLKMHSTSESEFLNMLECTMCKLQFDTMEDFEEHCKSKMHKNSFKKLNCNQPKVQCTVCEKFITKSYFNLHLKLHGDKEEKEELLRQCPYCEKAVVYSYYHAHIRRIHKDKLSAEELATGKKTKPETFICDICGKALKKKHNLELHILTHGSELKYKCMFCPYRGLHAGLLKIHIRTHTKDYNYKCTECPAKFLTNSNLRKHLQRHKGMGDYECDSCEKRFYSKTELNQHIEAIHLRIKKHVCNICGKAFSCRNYMMCHQLKVHKRKKLTDGKGRLAKYLVNEINNSFENENSAEDQNDSNSIASES